MRNTITEISDTNTMRNETRKSEVPLHFKKVFPLTMRNDFLNATMSMRSEGLLMHAVYKSGLKALKGSIRPLKAL